ncbi:SgcJ/EcaC family oxidoreductase [Amycolatopsis mediterranei]
MSISQRRPGRSSRPGPVASLGDGCAVLITQGACLVTGESAVAEEQAVRVYWVAVERDGRWWIAAYENSLPCRPLPVSGS